MNLFFVQYTPYATVSMPGEMIEASSARAAVDHLRQKQGFHPPGEVIVMWDGGHEITGAISAVNENEGIYLTPMSKEQLRFANRMYTSALLDNKPVPRITVDDLLEKPMPTRFERDPLED